MKTPQELASAAYILTKESSNLPGSWADAYRKEFDALELVPLERDAGIRWNRAERRANFDQLLGY